MTLLQTQQCIKYFKLLLLSSVTRDLRHSLSEIVLFKITTAEDVGSFDFSAVLSYEYNKIVVYIPTLTVTLCRPMHYCWFYYHVKPNRYYTALIPNIVCGLLQMTEWLLDLWKKIITAWWQRLYLLCHNKSFIAIKKCLWKNQ